MIKQSQSLNATSEKKKSSKKKKDEEQEVDVNKLMDEIKVNILNVYGIKDTSSQEYMELSQKSALQLLQDIELEINSNITKIKYIMKMQDNGEANKDDPWYKLVMK